MNKNEYYNSVICYKNPEYKQVRKYLSEWKQTNNITKKCVIHHRDDTEECRAYNEAFYERWGCDEDGTFEYGKYVFFMTISDHVKHHHTGKTLSDECKRKLSESHLGKHASDETKRKISDSIKGENHPMYGKSPTAESIAKNRESNIKVSIAAKYLYTTYKENGGKLQWKAFRHALKIGDITFKMQPISVFIDGGSK